MNCTNTETPLALKWRKTVKALAIHFSHNNEDLVQKNLYNNHSGIKSQLRLQSWSGLCTFGKVTIIINSLLLIRLLKIYTSC